MPKYFEADELSRAKFHPLPYTHITPADIKDKEAYERGWNDAIDAIIESAPTADVVERKDLDKITEAHEQIGYEKGYADGRAARDAEIVRCKDCKYREGSMCDYSAVYVRPNGYCQWGEKEEEPTMEEYMYGQEGSEEDGSL